MRERMIIFAIDQFKHNQHQLEDRILKYDQIIFTTKGVPHPQYHSRSHFSFLLLSSCSQVREDFIIVVNPNYLPLLQYVSLEPLLLYIPLNL